MTVTQIARPRLKGRDRRPEWMWEKKIDVIVGALTMEQWEIIPSLKEGTLDLSGLKRREFTEY